MIQRAPREEGFTVLQNETCEDEDLSWESLGLLTFLLSKPDNWTVSVEHLISCRDAGRHKIRRVLSELQEAGYLVRKRTQDEQGQFQWQSVVFDTKQGDSKTIPQKSVDGSSTDGSPTDGKPSDITNKDSNKEGENKEGEQNAPACGKRLGESENKMLTEILNVMRQAGTLTQRLEAKGYSLAEALVGEYPPRIVANALREDLDGSLQRWNAHVFKDSVLPSYIESTTDTKPKSAQDHRGGAKTQSTPDDIRSEIR